jgi:hypothetical protein
MSEGNVACFNKSSKNDWIWAVCVHDPY